MEKISKQAIKTRYLELAEALIHKHRIKRQQDFARSIRISPNQWSNIKTLDDKYISPEIISNTLLAYKDCNANWILTGDGEMFIDSNNITPTVIKKDVKSEGDSLEWANKLIEKLERENQFLRSIIIQAGLGKNEVYQELSAFVIDECLSLRPEQGSNIFLLLDNKFGYTQVRFRA